MFSIFLSAGALQILFFVVNLAIFPPFGNGTIEKLRAHFQTQQLERQAVGDQWHEHDLIFPSVVGPPLDHCNVLKGFKEFLELAGLPKVGFHDLRHTAATMMLQQGVHPKVVQERLGHAEISLTLNTYSHVLPSMQEEAAEAVDSLITLIDISASKEAVRKGA